MSVVSFFQIQDDPVDADEVDDDSASSSDLSSPSLFPSHCQL